MTNHSQGSPTIFPKDTYALIEFVGSRKGMDVDLSSPSPLPGLAQTCSVPTQVCSGDRELVPQRVDATWRRRIPSIIAERWPYNPLHLKAPFVSPHFGGRIWGQICWSLGDPKHLPVVKLALFEDGMMGKSVGVPRTYAHFRSRIHACSIQNNVDLQMSCLYTFDVWLCFPIRQAVAR